MAESNYTEIPYQNNNPAYRDTFAHFVAKQFKQHGHTIETVYSYLWTIGVPREIIKGVMMDVFNADPAELRQDPYAVKGTAPMPKAYFNQDMPNRKEQDNDEKYGLKMQPESLQSLAEAFMNPPKDVPGIAEFDYSRNGNVFKFETDADTAEKLKSVLGGVIIGESLLVVEALNGGVKEFSHRFMQDLQSSGLLEEYHIRGHWETKINGVPVEMEVDGADNKFIITDGGVDEIRESIRSKIISEWGFEQVNSKSSVERYVNERRGVKADFASDLIVFYPISVV